MLPSGYGELMLGMTFFTLIQQLIIGPIVNGFARYYSIAQERGQIKPYLSAVWSLLTKYIVVTTGIFILLLLGLIATGKSVWVHLLLFSFLFTVVSGYNLALDNIQNAARQRVVVAWHQGLSQWLRFLLAAWLIMVFGSSSMYAMLGYFLSAVIIIFSQWYFFRKNTLYKHSDDLGQVRVGSTNWERQMFRFALPFSMWGLFTWAQMSSDRWALQAFQSTASVGLYAVVYQLGYYPITILTSVFVQFISPVLYRRAGDAVDLERVRSTQKFTNQITIAALGFTALATFLAWLFREIIFSLLVAPGFHEVSFLLPWMALSGGLFAAGQISALTALNNNQPSTLLKPKILTGILGTVLSIIGAYLYGLEGVVGAGVIFSLTYFTWIYWLLRPKASLEMEIGPR
jgi:O-antigen/teichoic acid export membrane protein